MELFDINKKVFEQQNWNEVSNVDKRKNFFLLNRFFSIQYPLQANILQHLRISQVGVIDFWHSFLSSIYKNKVPFWIFTKGIKKSEKAKTKTINISNEIINEYCKLNKIEYKSMQDYIEFYPEKAEKELKSFEKIIKQK